MSGYQELLSQHQFKSKLEFSNRTNELSQTKKLASETPYIILEIPQEMLIFWHNIKAIEHVSYAKLISATQELPFGIATTAPAFEKRINDMVCIATRQCRGKSGANKG